MQRDLERVTEVYEKEIGEVFPGQLDILRRMILLFGLRQTTAVIKQAGAKSVTSVKVVASFAQKQHEENYPGQSPRPRAVNDPHDEHRNEMTAYEEYALMIRDRECQGYHSLKKEGPCFYEVCQVDKCAIYHTPQCPYPGEGPGDCRTFTWMVEATGKDGLPPGRQFKFDPSARINRHRSMLKTQEEIDKSSRSSPGQARLQGDGQGRPRP